MNDVSLGWSLAGWIFGGGDVAGEVRAPKRFLAPQGSSVPDPSSEITDRSAIAHQDAALLTRLQRGQPDAMDQLVTTYGAALIEVAHMVTGAPDTAQDVTQEVLYWIWDNRATLHVRSSLFAYLARAVRNRALNMVRHERSREAREMVIADVATIPAVAAETLESETESEFLTALHDALAQLQPRTREIFLMRADLGMSSQEVAEVLGIGGATVRNQLSIAVKTLASRLARFRGLERLRT